MGVGFANNVCGCQWLYFIDRLTVAKVYNRDMSKLSSGVQAPPAYVKYIKQARQFAIEARDVFDSCDPSFPEEHWHWREVDIEKLIAKVENKTDTELSQQEHKTLMERMNWAKARMSRISFNRFCLFIGEAIRYRFDHDVNGDVGYSITEAVDCYMR